MTKQLYEEALADVKKLKEVAEDNAKRAILEAVTPRIRDLIENQLLGETSEMEVDDPEKLLLDDPDLLGAVPGVGDSDTAASAISMPDDEGKVTLDLDALQTQRPDEFELSMESAQALGLLGTSSKAAVLESRINSLQEKLNKFAKASGLIKESAGYSRQIFSMLSEVKDMYSYLRNNLGSNPSTSKYESMIKKQYSTLKQLMEQNKMKRNRRLTEEDVTLKLTGLPDEVDLDSIGVDLITGEGGDEGEESESGDEELDLDTEEGGDEDEEAGDDEELELDLDTEEGGDEDEESSEDEGEEKMESRRLGDNVIVEIDEGMLRHEIRRMKSLREEAETKAQSWGHGPGEVSDDFEDDDLGDPFVDVKLTTESDDDMQDEQDDMQNESDDDMQNELDQAEDVEQYGGARDEAQSRKQSRQPGATVESILRRLRAESRLQLEAKRKAQSAKKQQKEAQQQGKKAKTQAAKKMQGKKAQQMKEAYEYYARKFNESVAYCSKLRAVLTEARTNASASNGAAQRSAAETSKLRTRLAETNLFNAKLLFTNKLLQNESLTRRQKAEVIERLDEARTEREVKLVYESLVKTLQGSSTQNLSESTNRGVIGSSSRPARPAGATMTESFEADRWARLAGIVK